jgi:hypothetical protein
MKNNYLEIKNVDFIIGGKTKLKMFPSQLKMKEKTLMYFGSIWYWKDKQF